MRVPRYVCVVLLLNWYGCAKHWNGTGIFSTANSMSEPFFVSEHSYWIQIIQVSGVHIIHQRTWRPNPNTFAKKAQPECFRVKAQVNLRYILEIEVSFWGDGCIEKDLLIQKSLHVSNSLYGNEVIPANEF